MTKEEAIQVADEILTYESDVPYISGRPRKVQIALVALMSTGALQYYEEKVSIATSNISWMWWTDKEKALKAWRKAEKALKEHRDLLYLLEEYESWVEGDDLGQWELVGAGLMYTSWANL